MMRVLYDGWSILYQPQSPAAMHLLAVLARLPEEVEPVVALPGPAPVWFPKIETLIQRSENNPKAQLQWEQRILLNVFKETQAQVLHLMRPNLPLLASPNTVLSPTGFDLDRTFKLNSRQKSGFFSRLRDALGRGGLSRVNAILWPSDLPEPRVQHPTIMLPPCVHPDFRLKPGRDGGSEVTKGLQLPETYALYHGPYTEEDLQRLIAAWSWAAGPIGVYYPLVILGLDQTARKQLSDLISKYELNETMISLSPVSLEVMQYLYRGCAALFHPAPISPWGGPVRRAMACGKPVVAAESGLSSAMVGPGAYLVPQEDTRGMGAALITSIVEEDVAESLSRAAQKRADSWQVHTFGKELATVYQRLAF